MKYLDQLADAFNRSMVTPADNVDGVIFTVEDGSLYFSRMMRAAHSSGKRVAVIGNGGSAAIASHFSIDLCKAAGIRSTTLGDMAALTCIANDDGFENVYAWQVERGGVAGDVLVAVSSSGRSTNILRAVEAAHKKMMHVVTFSGFAPDNPLRNSGDLNFYVPSDLYGFVELAHQIMLHAITDEMAAERGRDREPLRKAELRPTREPIKAYDAKGRLAGTVVRRLGSGEVH